MPGGQRKMTDKNEEIVAAINALKLEISTVQSALTQQIAAAVKTIRETVLAGPGRGTASPVQNTLPAVSAEETALAQQLKQYCNDTLPQLDRVLEDAKRKGQNLPVVRTVVARISEYLQTADGDLAGKGSFFLRTEIEKLQTTVNTLKMKLGSGAKSTTPTIPFLSATERARKTPDTIQQKKSAPAPHGRKVSLSASGHPAAETASLPKGRVVAAGAKAS
jgi:hypothetical protein